MTCKERHFVCESCGEEFHSDPSFTHEDAIQESLDNFGHSDDGASICDSCYQLFMEWYSHKKEHGLLPER